MLDQHERRDADVDEQRAQDEASPGRIGHENPVAALPQVGARDGAGMQRRALRGRQRFRNDAQAPGRPQGADHGQRPEHQAPAAMAQQVAAYHRGQDGRNHHHLHQHGKHARRLLHGAGIRDDGTRRHQASRRAQRLQEARGQQPLHAGRQRGHDRAQHENAQADQQRPAPAEAVQQRPVKPLAQRQAHQKHRQGLLYLPGRSPQLPRHGGKGRQIHVDGHGVQRGDHGQQEEEGPTEVDARRRGRKGHGAVPQRQPAGVHGKARLPNGR
ncbi:hypothetical protein D3C78_1199370 [compost metagenome]